jgi:hypothetical protein
MSNYYDMAKYSRLVCARMNSFCRCLAWQFWRREWKNGGPSQPFVPEHFLISRKKLRMFQNQKKILRLKTTK